MWIEFAAYVFVLLPSMVSASADEIQLVGVATIPADASDRSGLRDALPDGTPHDRLGGLGSAIAYMGEGAKYILVPDRGPKDGAVPFACRFHTFDILVNPGQTPAIQLKLLSTTMLSDGDGKPISGSVDALTQRMDPEGARLSVNKTLYLSDEYGPYIDEFELDGKRKKRFTIPNKFKVFRPDADPARERSINPTGRVPNRGFEGLALSPKGDKLFAVLQSPLIQDGGRDGLHVRLLELDIHSGDTREFVYPLTDKSHGLSEIVALDSDKFLVIERDSRAGAEARFKKLMQIEIGDATDVLTKPQLPPTQLPADIKPVVKSEFLDLLNPRFGLAGARFPEKIEGVCLGPLLSDGRRVLLVTSDNDFKAEEPTYIFAFSSAATRPPGAPCHNLRP
jgi:hypothetical protein